VKAGLFPGQGIGAKAVLEGLDPDHPRVAQAAEALGYDLVRRIEQVSRRSRDVMPTTLAQPAIFVAGVAAYEEAVKRDGPFDYLLGHSLGEYTALVAAGSIPFGHGLKLISARADTMHRASVVGSGGMAAVLGLAPEMVERIAISNDLALANDNSPKQTVLSGDTEDLSRAANDVRDAGGRSVLLSVEGAFHSSAMLPAATDLSDALMSTDVRNSSTSVISNVTARPYRSPGEIRKLLLAQLTGRVRYRESLLYLAEQGVTEFIDLGPGEVVARLAQATISSIEETSDA
jgi:malonyl CoA-acyl carrier protein transacylase